MTGATADLFSVSDALHEGLMSIDALNPAEVRLAAMNLLARREHSLQEMHNKLQRRFSDEAVVESVLQRLAAENLQSDRRFARSYLRQRSGRGFGPLRVRQEIRERGVSEEDLAAALSGESPQWQDIATAAYHKKFGAEFPATLQEKSRRARFMQYRGFNPEHYQHLLDD